MPPMKGLARARRGARLIVREHVSLSREAEEALFRVAEVLSEGDLRDGGRGERAWYGSTMISFDLERLAAEWRGVLDDATRARVMRAVEGSVRMRLRAMRIAHREVARRVPDRSLGTASVEIRVRLAGAWLHVDVDLEVPVGVSSRRSRR